MNPKNLALGTIAGGIVMFLLGFIFYAVLLGDFFDSNSGNIPGVARENPQVALIFLGNLFIALLVTIIYDRWAGIKTFPTGAKAGAVIGLLFALGYDMILYATTNIGNMTSVIADSLVQMVILAIGGGVIGLLLGKMENKV